MESSCGFQWGRICLQSLRDRLSLLVSEAGSWKAEYWPGIPSTEIFVQSNLMCPENFRVSPPSCFHLPKPKETTYRATTINSKFQRHASKVPRSFSSSCKRDQFFKKNGTRSTPRTFIAEGGDVESDIRCPICRYQVQIALKLIF